MCVCVFVCCHPIYSGLQTCGCTSWGHTGGRSQSISPPSSCGACLNFYREKDSAVPFPRRPCSRTLCTRELIVLHLLLGMIFFFVCVRKSPDSWDCTETRTHVPTSEGFEVTNCTTGANKHVFFRQRLVLFLFIPTVSCP